MISSAAATVVAVAVVCSLLWSFLLPHHASTEPPVLRPKVPLLGHIFGFWKHSAGYLKILGSQSPAPVYTILLPRFKFYVVNSVESFRFVFSKTQAFSGHVVLSTAMASICGCSAEGIERLVAPMKHDKGEKGNQETLVSAMRGVMENPVEHRAMSQEMLTHVDVAMEELKRGVGSIALRKWLRGRMTLWVTNTVYGPRNPFKDADTAEAFWLFLRHLPWAMIYGLPAVFQRKAVIYREKVARAYLGYFQSGGLQETSTLTRSRWEHFESLGISPEDVAGLEIVNAIAFLTNTSLAMWFMVFEIYSRPELLEKIREQLRGILQSEKGADGSPLQRLNVSKLKKECLLLLATYNEVLRFRTAAASVRRVLQDIMVGPYLLKEGTILLAPSGVFQDDTKLWGEDVGTFHPERWLKSDGSVRAVSSSPMWPWGGGDSLCPGRHFATTDVLVTASLLAMQFDFTPVTGTWAGPESIKKKSTAAALRSGWDVEVQVKEREEFKGNKWVIEA